MASTKFTSSPRPAATKVVFPDVCKTPSPPAPFVPLPYPTSQYAKNLKQANNVDAKAVAGDEGAKKMQKLAIDQLKKSLSAGDEVGVLKGVTSASQACKIGFVLHKGGVGIPLKGKSTAMNMTLAGKRQR